MFSFFIEKDSPAQEDPDISRINHIYTLLICVLMIVQDAPIFSHIASRSTIKYNHSMNLYEFVLSTMLRCIGGYPELKLR